MKQKYNKILSIIGFLYPIVLLLFFESINDYTIRFIIAYLCIYIAFFSLCEILPRKTAVIFFGFGSILFSIISCIDCFLAYRFENTLTSDMAYIFFETNKVESKQFLQNYINPSALLIIVSIFFFYILGIFFYSKAKNKDNTYKKSRYIISLSLIILVIAGYNIKFYKYFMPSHLKNKYTEYKVYRSSLIKTYKNKTGGNFTNVTRQDKDSTIAVVIIGEATARSHMSHYNYPRNTNPLLLKQKRLIKFTNVESPHCSTISSLKDVLTYADRKHEERVEDGSIIQLCNKAGFETFWISNQGASGKNNSTVTNISESCDFRNFTIGPKRIVYDLDEKVFPKFDEFLEADYKNKIIFVHLIGCHVAYKFRFSPKFNKFSDDFPGKYFSVNSKQKINIINEYDNAVLYDDYVVNSIIEKVKKLNKKSYVLFFPDHGEDVYEVNKNYYGHYNDNSTPPMYQIPFLLWSSNKIKSIENIDRNKSYNTENMLYTIADLLHINFDEMEKSKSILFPF